MLPRAAWHSGGCGRGGMRCMLPPAAWFLAAVAAATGCLMHNARFGAPAHYWAWREAAPCRIYFVGILKLAW